MPLLDTAAEARSIALRVAAEGLRSAGAVALVARGLDGALFVDPFGLPIHFSINQKMRGDVYQSVAAPVPRFEGAGGGLRRVPRGARESFVSSAWVTAPLVNALIFLMSSARFGPALL